MAAVILLVQLGFQQHPSIANTSSPDPSLCAWKGVAMSLGVVCFGYSSSDYSQQKRKYVFHT